jgi:predicted RNase H-like nuclease
LVAQAQAGWRLVAAEASYQHFYDRAEGRPSGRPIASRPRPSALLASAMRLCGRPVDLIAIDIPLAHGPITGRRRSDDEVSRAYGARDFETLSPSVARPGLIGRELKKGFRIAGYPLLTEAAEPPGVIEVCPHPALLELTGAAKRMPYEATKARSYWGWATPAQRHDLMRRERDQIKSLLQHEIAGVEAALPPPDPQARIGELKAYENMLDAVICAWVGVRALEGGAIPFGDANSAIWVPKIRLPTGAKC